MGSQTRTGGPPGPPVTPTTPAAKLAEVIASMDADAFIALSDERAWWERRLQATERYGYQRGYAAGRKAGYEQASADMDRAWHEIADPISRGRPYAELESRRWTVRGEQRDRGTYGDWHFFDHPGGPVEWDGGR